MPFFHSVVSIDVRLAPEEVERRLLRVVRRPRKLMEVLRGVPAGPPEHPDFVGSVGSGRFTLSRLGDVASSVGRFQSVRPSFRGTITRAGAGSALRITFFDVGLTVLVFGMVLALGLVFLAAALSGTLWRVENALIIVVMGLGLWGYRRSNRDEVEASVALIRSSLDRSASAVP
jgi:hypothetical protein